MIAEGDSLDNKGTVGSTRPQLTAHGSQHAALASVVAGDSSSDRGPAGSCRSQHFHIALVGLLNTRYNS